VRKLGKGGTASAGGQLSAKRGTKPFFFFRPVDTQMGASKECPNTLLGINRLNIIRVYMGGGVGAE